MKSTTQQHNWTLDYFQNLVPERKIVAVVPYQGGYSSAALFLLKTPHGDLIARKSAAIYGADGFTQEILIHRQASAHALAPNIVAVDEVALMAVFDFVRDQGSKQRFHNNPHATLHELITLARRMHAIPAPKASKPSALVAELTSLYRALPRSMLTTKSIALFDALSTYSFPNDLMTLTHFDFQPSNILYDGTRYFVIDWEMAGLGHPYFDLAVLSNFLLLDQAQGHDVLARYLSLSSLRHKAVMFDTMRAVSYAFLAAVNFFEARNLSAEHNAMTDQDQRIIHDPFTAWQVAKATQSAKGHYSLGSYFIEHALRYAYGISSLCSWKSLFHH